MHRRFVRAAPRVLACGALVLTVAQCSSSDASPATPAAPTTSLVVTYGDDPTVSAQMVCGEDGQTALAAAFPVAGLKVTTPTWVDHLYSCTYQYPVGSFDLSVKELPTIAETVDYFTALKSKATDTQQMTLGQDGFVGADGTSVVRKDNKVLIVDVSKLPAQFSTPPQTPIQASQNIAFILLGCWTGD